MSFDHRAFRDTLGCFATGICIVTCVNSDGEPHGVTVNSFSSVSLDPPLVLFSLDRSASTFGHFMHTEAFAVNVLSAEQEELSRNFASSPGDRWTGIEYATWATGSPILQRSLAALDCDVHARHDGGDHVIFVGRVRALATAPDGQPLIYFRGRYATLGE